MSKQFISKNNRTLPLLFGSQEFIQLEEIAGKICQHTFLQYYAGGDGYEDQLLRRNNTG